MAIGAWLGGGIVTVIRYVVKFPPDTGAARLTHFPLLSPGLEALTHRTFLYPQPSLCPSHGIITNNN